MITSAPGSPSFASGATLPHAGLARPRPLSIGAHIGANLIWAGSAVASKPLLQVLPPMTLAAVRVAIALVVLSALLAARHERPARGSAPALLGLVGVAFFCATQNLGLLFADATMTALITGCIPALTLGLAVPVLHERLDEWRIAGIVVSILGIGVIVMAGSAKPLSTAVLTGILPLTSALASALYMVLGRRVFVGGSPLAVVTGSSRYGLMFLVPGVIIELVMVDAGHVATRDIVLLTYLGAGCSAIAFVLRGFGLKHLGASHGAVYGNLRPVIGAALAMALLGEPLTTVHIAGGAMVLCGVGMAGKQPSHRRLRPSPATPCRLAGQ